MEKAGRVKKAAHVLFVVVSLMLLYNIILIGWVGFTGFYVMDPMPGGASLNPLKVVLDVIQTLISLLLLISALIVLLSIKKDETPFKLKNVRLLKRMAILLAVLDPYAMISSRVPALLVENGPATNMSIWPSGYCLVAGIVIYCVSIVFEYGMILQRQFDETL